MHVYSDVNPVHGSFSRVQSWARLLRCKSHYVHWGLFPGKHRKDCRLTASSILPSLLVQLCRKAAHSYIPRTPFWHSSLYLLLCNGSPRTCTSDFAGAIPWRKRGRGKIEFGIVLWKPIEIHKDIEMMGQVHFLWQTFFLKSPSPHFLSLLKQLRCPGHQ